MRSLGAVVQTAYCSQATCCSLSVPLRAAQVADP
jgi:hypothetical protein